MNRLYQSLDEKWSPDANLRPRPNVSVIIVNYACSEATIAAITPPLSGMLSAALFISNFQVGGIGR